ncbi:hypothetical protein SBD_2145 [Streptomyces bottropensis ATCC 25435]|uniref:Uncharacterized protein n=1 Tax=Streptomyces bottropensis ATCC 25435 TaxID=1054862 RepID=M3FVZ3_9ACTN|nr:hypothetical protein SBD_2145 [Streptomyces bottropensis ATCC 25435]
MLIGDQGQLGDSNWPRLAAEASCHGDTSPTSAQRETAAFHAPTTAATASANRLADAAGGMGSGPVSTSSTVKYTRTCSACCSNRRSQPRTVSTGRPNRAAIVLAPEPAAFATSAVPITSAKSTRLTSTNTGRSTCEPPQPEHRARRGRTRTTPSVSRSTRCLAHPHGASTPPQSGHSTSPDNNLASIRAASASTVSTGASMRCTALPDSAKRSSGGPSHALLIGKVSPPTNTPTPPACVRIRRHTACLQLTAHIGILSAVEHGTGSNRDTTAGNPPGEQLARPPSQRCRTTNTPPQPTQPYGPVAPESRISPRSRARPAPSFV